MKKTKSSILGFCVILMTILLFLIPFNAKTAGLDSRFGINAFVLNRYDWGEWDRPIERLEELKVNWTREEFVWKQIEPQKGKYEWGFYDKAFGKITDADINILGIIDYSAPWATEDPGRADADKYVPNMVEWRRYVGKIVDRYGDKVRYWQIWNEPNLPIFFRPAPNVSDYMDILKNASEVIREKDSSAKVVLGGLSGVDVGYLRELKRMGAEDYFDILAVHPYRFDFNSPPEIGGLERDLDDADVIAGEFGNKNIWLTEFGWPTDNQEGVSESLQAKYLVRTYLVALSHSNIKKIFWYDFRDDGNDKDYREDNFGLLRRDYSRKESFMAYKNLIDILEHSEFESAPKNGEGGSYEFLFKKSNQDIKVLWRASGVEDFSLRMEKSMTVYDFFGNVIWDGSNAGSVVNLKVSDAPIFIVSNKINSGD